MLDANTTGPGPRDPGSTDCGRVAIIGDVGGHRAELAAELVRLGADKRSLTLPADLTVVQVGDLVHRGPESEGVVALVDRYLRSSPRQWIQLAGNHEAQYLREPAFEWPTRIESEAAQALRSWWASGAMRVAAAVRTPGEDLLVTHAGLTEGYWRLALDEPADAFRAAAALNSFVGDHEDVLFAPGQMLGGGDPDYAAGPMWAAAATELVPSWLRADVDMPFSQAHGHSTITDWKRGHLRAEPAVAALVDSDMTTLQETVSMPGGRRIVGVDPGHGHRARRAWRALVVTGEVVEPAAA